MLKTFILCVLLLASSALAEEAPTSRQLRCRVVDENDHPVASLRVFLCGLDRSAPSSEELVDSAEFHPDWIFTTDGQGCFTVEFGKFDPYQHEGPGYGRFHFVTMKPGWAGGVSRMIVNAEDPGSFTPPSGQPRPDGVDLDEWRRGEFAPWVLTDQPESKPLDIVLKRGVEVRGQMVDRRGRPMRGRSMELGQNLHYGSHTGEGGEIFGQSTVTNQAGRFRFHHVYPNRFRVKPSWEGYPIRWVRTRVRGRWMDGAVDEISPRTSEEPRPQGYERILTLRLLVERPRMYRYFGRVIDARGSPVSGLNVRLQTSSRHGPPGLFGDQQAEKARTDQRGRYSVRVAVPSVDFIYGDGAGVTGGTETRDVPLPPGKYDFIVRPKKLGE